MTPRWPTGSTACSADRLQIGYKTPFDRHESMERKTPQAIGPAAFLFRATGGTRTLNPRFTKAVLYRLSYGGVTWVYVPTRLAS